MKFQIATALILFLFLVPSAYTETIPELTVEEVKEKIFDLEGKTIRLEFNFRREINQIAKGQYSTRLYSIEKRNSSTYCYIYASFDEDGFDYVKRISTSWGYKKTKKLYAKVVNSRIVLIGRTQHKDIYREISYIW